MSLGNIYGPPPQKEAVWNVFRINLFDDPSPWESGTRLERSIVPFNSIYINDVQRRCRLWMGTGRRYFIGDLDPGQRRTVQLPTIVDEFTVEWDGFQSETVAPFETTIDPILDLWTATDVIFYGESFDVGPRLSAFFRPSAPSLNGSDFTIIGVPVDSPIVISLPVLTSTDPLFGGYTSIGNALGDNAPPTMQTAVGQYTVWDTATTAVSPAGDPANVVRGSVRALTNSYSVVFRSAVRPYVGANGMVANSREALATIWHEASTTRTLRLRRIEIGIYELSAASQIVFDLVGIITAAPSGGTLRIPRPHNQVANAANALCRYNPTAGVTESGEVLSSFFYNPVAAVANVDVDWITLYDDTFPDAVEPPALRANIAEGFAVMMDTVSAVTITAIAKATFTEH